jgi:hypothetical protein
VREEGVLLGFVEAMNFVNEQNGLLPSHRQAVVGPFDDLP